MSATKRQPHTQQPAAAAAAASTEEGEEWDDESAPKHPYDPYSAEHINDHTLPSHIRTARPSSVLTAVLRRTTTTTSAGVGGPKPLLDVVFVSTIFMVAALGLYLLVQR